MPNSGPTLAIHELLKVYTPYLKMFADVGNTRPVWRLAFFGNHYSSSSLGLRDKEGVRGLPFRIAMLALQILPEMSHAEYAGNKLDLLSAWVREEVFVIQGPCVCDLSLIADSKLSHDFSG